MNTKLKPILAAATLAAPLAAGCVMIADPDIDDHYVDSCDDCHLVVVSNKTAADSMQVMPDSALTGQCLRAGI